MAVNAATSADIPALQRDIDRMKQLEAKLEKLRTGIDRGEIIPAGNSSQDRIFRSTRDLREAYTEAGISAELLFSQRHNVEPNFAEAEKQALKLLNLYLSSRRATARKALTDITNRKGAATQFRQKLEGRLYVAQRKERESIEAKRAVGAVGDFGGDWDSFIAAPFRIPIELTLSQNGNSVTGDYKMEGKYTQEGKDVIGTLKGMIDKQGALKFEWKDNFGAFGKGEFRVVKNGNEIIGKIGTGDAVPNRLWNATRKSKS
jgi:hypothetical protein